MYDFSLVFTASVLQMFYVQMYKCALHFGGTVVIPLRNPFNQNSILHFSFHSVSFIFVMMTNSAKRGCESSPTESLSDVFFLTAASSLGIRDQILNQRFSTGFHSRPL